MQNCRLASYTQCKVFLTACQLLAQRDYISSASIAICSRITRHDKNLTKLATISAIRKNGKS